MVMLKRIATLVVGIVLTSLLMMECPDTFNFRLA